MKLKLLTVLIVLCFSPMLYAQQNEGDFYKSNKNGDRELSISTLTGEETSADSNRLNTAIRNLSGKNAPNGKKGGTLTLVPNGNVTTVYLKNIKLRSNVHLKIDSRFTIIPQTIGSRVFEMGDSGFVTNAALTSTSNSTNKSGAFKVKLRAQINKNESVLKVGNASNFKVSGINILDKQTKISGITMSIQGTLVDKSKIPRNGVVENLWINNAHVGYGLIQAQAAKHVLFKNINGVGGVTMRFESGNDQLLQSTGSSVDSVYIEGVSIRNGDAALNVSPHRSNQGSVNAVGVKAYNSTWAVQVSKGFIGTEGADAPFANNKGTYRSVKIVIKEISGGNGAQIKGKDFPLFKCDSAERSRLNAALTNAVKATTSCVIGNSIGGARASASIACSGGGCYSSNITYATASKTSGNFQIGARGFGGGVPNCSSTSRISKDVLDDDQNIDVDLSVSPNPASGNVNVYTESGSTISIYNSFGVVVKSIKNVATSNDVDISDLYSGIYFVRSVSLSGKRSTTKLIIN